MRVLVVGASGGVGAALADEAARRGAAVTRLSRSADGLDVTDADSVTRLMGALQGPYDAVLVATGGLEIGGRGPEKSLRALDPAALAAQFALNATGPALVLREAVRLFPRQGRAVFAALSARVGSIGDNRSGGWYGYRAAKAALNQILRSAAIELACSHPDLIVAALHPGTVQTDLTARYLGRHPAVPPLEAARNLWSVIDGLTPARSGGFFDWAGQEIAW
jgi:NAD(P)-dependent dehydrogenase (short-subunit alcohol dehydrogenase family)